MRGVASLLPIAAAGGGMAFACSEALRAAGIDDHVTGAIGIGLAIAAADAVDRRRLA